MSSTLPPEFDLSRLAGIPDPAHGERPPELAAPATPEAAPLRMERLARQRVVLAFSVSWMVGQVVVLGARRDLSDVPWTYLVALVIAPLVGAGLALALAMAPGKLGLGARPPLSAAMAVGLPASLLLAGFLLSPAHESGPEGTFAQGLRCCALMAAWSALPMGAAALVLRRWFVVRAGLRSALVGIAAGMAAAAVMNLHCHVTGVWHVALGHWVAVALAALFGAWALARRTRI